ncbi:MAG: hypothetical protein FWF54_07260 [Candidatus Azobacteroides sp.]|nr:hypothetical protein [Candidatus Azobacteroides sp.]
MLHVNDIKSFSRHLPEKTRNFFRSEQFHRSLIFLFFLLVAFIFWILQVMRESYTHSYEIPLVYKHLPDEVVITGDLPESIQITVSAKGSSLFQYSYRKKFHPIVIDVSKTKKGQDAYTVSSDLLKSEIRKQLITDTGLLGVSPDNIEIYYALEESRKIPVYINATILPASQRMLSGNIEAIPDRITVYAQKSVLDTLSTASTVYFEEKNLQDTLIRKTALKKINGVKFVPDRVNVLIPVEEFTEKTLEIPVYPVNVPQNVIMRTFPAKVKISFFVVLSKFNTIKEPEFQATVDYLDFKKDTIGKLKIDLSKYPAAIDNIRLSADKVDVLLEEKSTKK